MMLARVSAFWPLALLVGCASLPAAAQGGTLAISAAHVWVGDGTVIENGTVLIRDGKIVAVGAGIAIPDDAERVAAPNGSLTPGLVDAAFQIGGPRGDTEQSSEVIPHLSVLDGFDPLDQVMQRLAREGVTTVFLTGDPASVIGPQCAVVKTGKRPAPRILVPRGPIKAAMTPEPKNRGRGNSGPGGRRPVSVMTRRPTTQMGTVFVFRDAFQQAANLRARRSAGAVESVDPSEAALIDLLDGKRSLRIAAQNLHEIASAERVAREFGLRFTMERALEAWRCLDQLASTGTAVIYGPVTAPAAQQGGFSPFGRETPADRKLGTPKALADRGIVFALTAHQGTGENGLARQAAAAMRHGLSAAQTLAAVSTTAAKLSGVEERVGLLRVGMDADVVVWSGAPFDPTSALEAVFIDGIKVEGRGF